MRQQWPLEKLDSCYCPSKCSFLSWVIKLSLAALSRNIFTTKWRRYANKNERSKSAITKRFGTLSSSSAAGWNKKATIFSSEKVRHVQTLSQQETYSFCLFLLSFLKVFYLGAAIISRASHSFCYWFLRSHLSLCWRRSYCFNPFVYFILFPICYLAAESLPVWG